MDCRIKIIDFGSAKKLVPGEKVTAIEGTPEFMAPEVINFDEITGNTGDMTEKYKQLIIFSMLRSMVCGGADICSPLWLLSISK